MRYDPLPGVPAGSGLEFNWSTSFIPRPLAGTPVLWRNLGRALGREGGFDGLLVVGIQVGESLGGGGLSPCSRGWGLFPWAMNFWGVKLSFLPLDPRTQTEDLRHWVCLTGGEMGRGIVRSSSPPYLNPHDVTSLIREMPSRLM